MSQNQGINEKFAIKCNKYKFKTESLSSTLADVCEVYANSSDDLSEPNKVDNVFDSNLHPHPYAYLWYWYMSFELKLTVLVRPR